MSLCIFNHETNYVKNVDLDAFLNVLYKVN